MLFKSAHIRTAATPAIEVKADSSGLIEGYGSIFGVVDSYGDRVVAGAYANTIAAHKSKGTMPKLLWQHVSHQPIGKWTDAREDGKGLLLTGQLNLKTTAGRDAYEHIVHGDIDGLSIGYHVVKYAQAGTVIDLKEIDLVEVSVVTVGACPDATIGRVKALESKDELIDMLRSGGLSKQAAARIAAGGWPALSKSNAPDDDAVARLAASIDHATRALRNL